MKHFIVQDNKKTVGKVLNGIELANRKNTLSMCGCSKIPCKKKHCSLWSISNIFFRKFIFPDNDSKIQDYKKLTNEALETLLNKLHSLDQEQNEKTNEYIKQ